MSRRALPTTELRGEHAEMRKRRRVLIQSGGHTAPRKRPHFVKTEIDMLTARILNLERRYDFSAPEAGSSK